MASRRFAQVRPDVRPVWDQLIPPEKERDPEKKGYAVTIKVDRAEDLGGGRRTRHKIALAVAFKSRVGPDALRAGAIRFWRLRRYAIKSIILHRSLPPMLAALAPHNDVG